MSTIIEINESTIQWLREVLDRALEFDQTVKFSINDGAGAQGIMVKRGESMWSAPLGHPLNRP